MRSTGLRLWSQWESGCRRNTSQRHQLTFSATGRQRTTEFNCVAFPKQLPAVHQQRALSTICMNVPTTISAEFQIEKCATTTATTTTTTATAITTTTAMTTKGRRFATSSRSNEEESTQSEKNMHIIHEGGKSWIAGEATPPGWFVTSLLEHMQPIIRDVGIEILKLSKAVEDPRLNQKLALAMGGQLMEELEVQPTEAQLVLDKWIKEMDSGMRKWLSGETERFESVMLGQVLPRALQTALRQVHADARSQGQQTVLQELTKVKFSKLEQSIRQFLTLVSQRHADTQLTREEAASLEFTTTNDEDTKADSNYGFFDKLTWRSDVRYVNRNATAALIGRKYHEKLSKTSLFIQKHSYSFADFASTTEYVRMPFDKTPRVRKK